MRPGVAFRNNIVGPPEMVGEVHIDWTAETAGTIGATYVDTVTGQTWTKTTGGTLGTMTLVISGSGLVFSGLAGGANASISFNSNVAGLINAVTGGSTYDPYVESIEIVQVCSNVNVTGAGTEVNVDTSTVEGGRLFRLGSLRTGGLQARRAAMVDGVGFIFADTTETFSAAVFAKRISGATGRYRWASSLASTTWSSLSEIAPNEVWSMRAGSGVADMDQAGDFDWNTGFSVIGQPAGVVGLTITDTYIRRWRSP